MKKLSITLFLILAFCAFCFAQSDFPEFNKASEIKLLISTREEVKVIFTSLKLDYSKEEEFVQYYSTENASIEVTFSEWNCTNVDSDWDVSEWLVTKIRITPRKELLLTDLDFDRSNFKKEVQIKNCSNLMFI